MEEYLPAQTRHDTMARMSKHRPKIIWPFPVYICEIQTIQYANLRMKMVISSDF